MDKPPHLTALREDEPAQALARFRILRPRLEGRISLRTLEQEQAVTLRTLQR